MPDFLIDLIQYTVAGALKGMLYAQVALGFIVIFRAGRILNFGQGEVVVIGGFIIYSFISLPFFPALVKSVFGNVPWWLFLIFALLVSAVIISIFGLLIERFIFRPMIGQPIFTIVMVTIGLMLLLQGLTIAIWGGGDRPFPFLFHEGAVRIGPFIFTRSLFWGGIMSLGIFGALSLLFEKTRWGLKLTAVAEDHAVSQSMGISVKRSIAIAWIISCLLSSWAAVVFLNGMTLTFAAGTIGLTALPVALLAGLESIWGAPVAGIIVGVGEALAAAYLDGYTEGAMSEAFPYLLMLVILLVRPQGLFGWKIIERV
ncbi:MAG: branched-chain amino acid ABC transporter permease [Proteobacteria bacterium]|nr:branched-chain amino acid ABC transporter permease [Pseudomonadota bacterium]